MTSPGAVIELILQKAGMVQSSERISCREGMPPAESILMFSPGTKFTPELRL